MCMICSHLSRPVISRTLLLLSLLLLLMMMLLLLVVFLTLHSVAIALAFALCCIFYFALCCCSLHISLCALCLFCAFLMHTSHWLLFFRFVWPFICCVVVVVCIFFAIFSFTLLCRFVRSAALNFNLPNEHKTCE